MKLLSDHSKAALQAVPRAGMPAPTDAFAGWLSTPFMNFSFTSQQLHVRRGEAWMTVEQLRCEDRKLSHERFEGQVPMEMVQQAVGDAQRIFTGQTLFFLEQFNSLMSMLLSYPGRRE
jgi:hypothetical protein